MADLTITAKDVALDNDGVIEKVSGPAASAISAGQVVYYNASGHFALALGDDAATASAIGVAISSAASAGQTVTVVRQGLLDLGAALDGMSYGANVYLSAAAAGTMADTAPAATNFAVELGTVIPAWATTSGSKLLRVAVSDPVEVEA